MGPDRPIPLESRNRYTLLASWPASQLSRALANGGQALAEVGTRDITLYNGRPRGLTSALALCVKVAVSGLLLWLALRNVRLDKVFEQIIAMDQRALLAGFVVLAGTTLIAALRWSIILRFLGMPRDLGVTYPLSLIGQFFGQALPAGVGGDAVRVWLGCKTGLSMPMSVSSILGDRLVGLFAILLIATIELPAVRIITPDSKLLYALLTMLVIFYAGFAVLLLLTFLPASWRRFRIVKGFVRVSSDLRILLFSPNAAFAVLSCGAFIQLCSVLAVFALARGLHLAISLKICLLIVPIANILQSLPLSIAGWGVRESFFVATFGAVGASASQALAVSILFGFLVVATSLPGGVLWVLKAGVQQPRQLAAGRLRHAQQPGVATGRVVARDRGLHAPSRCHVEPDIPG